MRKLLIGILLVAIFGCKQEASESVQNTASASIQSASNTVTDNASAQEQGQKEHDEFNSKASFIIKHVDIKQIGGTSDEFMTVTFTAVNNTNKPLLSVNGSLRVGTTDQQSSDSFVVNHKFKPAIDPTQSQNFKVDIYGNTSPKVLMQQFGANAEVYVDMVDTELVYGDGSIDRYNIYENMRKHGIQ